jgi:hypothetical protein
MISYFTKDIDLKNKNLTHDLHIWLEYLCWCIQAKMKSSLYWPRWVRVRWFKLFGFPIYHPPLINKPWRTVKFFLRSHTGGRSHRCEFTDPKKGALYGYDNGAFMDLYFDEFIRRISQ